MTTSDDIEATKISIDLLTKYLISLNNKNQIVTKSKVNRRLNLDQEMEIEEEKQIKQEVDITDENHEKVKGMFDYKNAPTNLTYLSNNYENKLTGEQIDERFLLEDGISVNPNNITPFARQGNANKLKDPKQMKREAEMNYQMSNTQFNSKRLLDYTSANAQNDDKGLTLSSQLKDIKFPSMIPCSPYSIRAFTPATPISLALEMVNWLKLKAENARKSLIDDRLPPVMHKYFEY